MPLDDHGALDGIEEGLSTKFNQDFGLPRPRKTEWRDEFDRNAAQMTPPAVPKRVYTKGALIHQMSGPPILDLNTPGQLVTAQADVRPKVIQSDPTGTDPIRTSGYYLIPPGPLGEVARVFQIGAEKYEPRGWEKGLPWSDVVDRAYRHLGRWLRGEKFDLEDGQHNLASVAWAALVLMEFEKTHPETDDVHDSRTV